MLLLVESYDTEVVTWTLCLLSWYKNQLFGRVVAIYEIDEVPIEVMGYVTVLGFHVVHSDLMQW